ncbi:MAG: putative lipid II flippase FtsW [Puniceicoccales bacterium]|jgi:cell division protein FtsW|nr:putative lipid II flippase FtsW [Puniceicoccales bacterium]
MSQLRRSNGLILSASICLTLYGLLILYSASQPFGPDMLLFKKQCVWLGIAFMGLLVFAFVNLEKLKTVAPILGLITLLALCIVLIPGVGLWIHGTRRWISLCGLRIQPSELAKIGFVIFFAHFLSEHVREVRYWFKGFMKPLGVIAVFACLVIVEPDFGTAFLFGWIGLVLLFLKGAQLKFIIPSCFCALLLFMLAIYLNPVRLRRITAFLDVEGNRLSGAYQLWQSLIGFSAGGLTGVGLGQGHQQYFFLPEAHTDFIFAILAEELGILHVLIVLCLFAIITFHGLKIVRSMGNPFLFFVGVGALSFLIFQAFFNMGVVTGLLPTKGLALPFLSYGGSNLLTSYCFIGILINLGRGRYHLPQNLRQHT